MRIFVLTFIFTFHSTTLKFSNHLSSLCYRYTRVHSCRIKKQHRYKIVASLFPAANSVLSVESETSQPPPSPSTFCKGHRWPYYGGTNASSFILFSSLLFEYQFSSLFTTCNSFEVRAWYVTLQKRLGSDQRNGISNRIYICLCVYVYVFVWRRARVIFFIFLWNSMRLSG